MTSAGAVRSRSMTSVAEKYSAPRTSYRLGEAAELYGAALYGTPPKRRVELELYVDDVA
tara:strand:+ start:324 stop:500 length:177 start_codon:yes stop_codon:yes gene_type:complete